VCNDTREGVLLNPSVILGFEFRLLPRPHSNGCNYLLAVTVEIFQEMYVKL